MHVTNTAEFREALKTDLDAAEDFLNAVRDDPDLYEARYDARWLDHREHELFQAFCATQDWIGAKRVVEATADAESKKGRIKRLEELSGTSYDSI